MGQLTTAYSGLSLARRTVGISNRLPSLATYECARGAQVSIEGRESNCHSSGTRTLLRDTLVFPEVQNGSLLGTREWLWGPAALWTAPCTCQF